jgi:DHA1 family bicyclomycin/chloramphenicol resistance-like MFS transporter
MPSRDREIPPAVWPYIWSIQLNRIIFLIALLAAFPPLSTDMYLPAIPILQKSWAQPLVTVNLTLIAFFIVYCFGMLFYGPLSDRFGRRPPLLIGISIYIVGSLLCALAQNVWMMVGFRILQAAGAASASALAIAMTKDLFRADLRAKILAYVSIILGLAPMIAPIVGGLVLTFLSWPYVFVLQAAMGVIAMYGVYRIEEPLKTKTDSGILRAMTAYVRLFRNARFTGLNAANAIIGIAFFAFLAGSADIYISHFGMTETMFGYFFAFNAFAMMAGSFSFSRIAGHVPFQHLITISFAGILVSGIWMFIGVNNDPWDLAIPMWALGFFLGLSRPPAINLTLEQVDRDTGAASAMIGFSFMLIGALGMWIISLGWTDKIAVIGTMAAVTGAADLLFWLLAKRKLTGPVPVKTEKKISN